MARHDRAQLIEPAIAAPSHRHSSTETRHERGVGKLLAACGDTQNAGSIDVASSLPDTVPDTARSLQLPRPQHADHVPFVGSGLDLQWTKAESQERVFCVLAERPGRPCE